MHYSIQYSLDDRGLWITWDSFSNLELAHEQRKRFEKKYKDKFHSVRIVCHKTTIVWEEGDAIR